MFIVSCVSYAFASVHCCLVVTCLEKADLLALVGDVHCIFVTFPRGILDQVWYLIVSIPDLYHLSYSVQSNCCSQPTKTIFFGRSTSKNLVGPNSIIM